MQKIWVAALLLIGCCSLQNPASAQSTGTGTVSDSTAYDTMLDEIVVTGTRSPKILKDSPVITRVFTESEIRKVDVTHIGELLQSELPGVEFSYSMSQQVSLNMQGFGGNSVLFLVDGERIAGETLDNIDYSRLNLENVQRIEIIKGAASSLYGSNALGGVVNIITKTPVDPLHVNVNSRFASHNEQRHGGSINVKTGRLNSATSVQYTSAGKIDMPNDAAYHTIYANHTVNVRERLQYKLGSDLKLTGRAGYFFRERDSQASSKDRYRSFNGGAKGEYAFHERSNMELAYSFDQYDKSNYLVENRLDVRNYSNVQHSVKGLYSYLFDDKKILTVGGDYMRDWLMSYQFKDNESYMQHVADIFVQYDWTPLEKLNIIGGLRYDYFSDASISHLSPKIGLMFKQGRFNFRGSYAGGFRAPTLKEMYMSFDMAGVFMIYGNKDLKAEKSHNFSLSGEYTRRYTNFSLIGYHNIVDNRITTVWNEELKGMQYMNIDNITITGIDANASMRLPSGIGARLSYAFTHEKIEKGQPQLSNTRPHAATARVEYGKSWKKYGFNIALNGRFLSKLTADEYTSLTSYEETQEVTYPAYTIWKLSLMQTFREGLHLIVGIDNLFNYVPGYYYSNSPYTTGTTFSAGVSIDINRL